MEPFSSVTRLNSHDREMRHPPGCDAVPGNRQHAGRGTQDIAAQTSDYQAGPVVPMQPRYGPATGCKSFPGVSRQHSRMAQAALHQRPDPGQEPVQRSRHAGVTRYREPRSPGRNATTRLPRSAHSQNQRLPGKALDPHRSTSHVHHPPHRHYPSAPATNRAQMRAGRPPPVMDFIGEPESCPTQTPTTSLSEPRPA